MTSRTVIAHIQRTRAIATAKNAGLLYADGSAKPALGAFGDAVHGLRAPIGSGVADVCPAQHHG